MLKRWFAPLIAVAALAGCGVGPVGQTLNNSLSTSVFGASSVGGHGLGFKFSAGRPMNPYQPDVYMGASLPSQVDLRSQDSPISDQGQLGACTAFAMGRGLRQFDELKEARMYAQQSPFGGFYNVPVQAAASFTELSPLWFYYAERVADGSDVSQDTGSTITTGMNVLTSQGIPPETDWPYDITKFSQKPPAKAYQDASEFKLSSKTPLNTLDDIKATVASGWPVVFGFQVYDNFMGIGSDGMMPMPTASNYVEGGHAVMVLGYDDARQVLIIRNSWGASWGDHGYFYMPYAYVTPDNVSDIWTGK